MNTIELSRFRILTGLRFENTSEDDAANTARLKKLWWGDDSEALGTARK